MGTACVAEKPQSSTRDATRGGICFCSSATASDARTGAGRVQYDSNPKCSKTISSSVSCMAVGHIGISESMSEHSAGLTLSTSLPSSRPHTCASVSQLTKHPRSRARRYWSPDGSLHVSIWSAMRVREAPTVRDRAMPLVASHLGVASPAKPAFTLPAPLSRTTVTGMRKTALKSITLQTQIDSHRADPLLCFACVGLRKLGRC
mmetsp:Transcript_11161/g.23831  ORF Transcript_11161/g.23831 Transcript_11161/m.23831 type:complete len:204 (-) Transcript_11161:38-649(-)